MSSCAGHTDASNVPLPSGLRVAVVDDFAPMRSVLRELFQDGGMQVVATYSDALSLIKELGLHPREGLLPLDVVVMDVRMPRLNGIEATRRLRAARPEIRVVVHSASASALADEALCAGAAAAVQKGDVDGLLAAVTGETGNAP